MCVIDIISWVPINMIYILYYAQLFQCSSCPILSNWGPCQPSFLVFCDTYITPSPPPLLCFFLSVSLFFILPPLLQNCLLSELLVFWHTPVFQTCVLSSAELPQAQQSPTHSSQNGQFPSFRKGHQRARPQRLWAWLCCWNAFAPGPFCLELISVSFSHFSHLHSYPQIFLSCFTLLVFFLYLQHNFINPLLFLIRSFTQSTGFSLILWKADTYCFFFSFSLEPMKVD